MQIFHTKQPFGNKVWNIIGQTAFITELVSHRLLLYPFNCEFTDMTVSLRHFYTKLEFNCIANFFGCRHKTL